MELTHISELYFEWVKYLKENKLYGAWVNDLSVYCDNYKKFITTPSNYPYQMSFRWNKGNKLMIGTYDAEIASDLISSNLQEVLAKFRILDCTLMRLSQLFIVSGTKWLTWINFFFDERNENKVLSSKLSRKMARRDIKFKKKPTEKVMKEKVNQPWFDCSYERFFNYRNKIWRR